jgi:DNA-binding transcriptional ArsR family regulator
MSQPSAPIDPSQFHRDAIPVTRVSTEFHLRAIDLLTGVQDDIIDSLIFMTLVRAQMIGPRRTAVATRELSRMLGMPAETVRRHILSLARRGQCVVTNSGVAVPSTVLRGRKVKTFLRKIYVNAVRLLADLTRIEVASFASSSRRAVEAGRLTKEQTTIAIAATGLLLAGLRALRTFWGGDLMRGLVYTAIWTANVKHLTNSTPAAHPISLPDSLRVPVSVSAISRSLRLPYETVRRHAESLVQDGICIRVERRGLFVPLAFIQRIAAGPVITHRLAMDFLAALRNAGVRV